MIMVDIARLMRNYGFAPLQLFPPDEDMPAKHKGYDFGTLVKRIVAARRIQNTWIIYQAVKREIQEENMADSYNSR